MNHRVCIILGLLALMILLAAGCGRGSHGGNVLPQPATGTGTETPTGSDIDAELAALTAPEGVDPVLFSHLKKALANALASVGKVVSTPPTGEDNIPANLTLTEGEGDEWTLSWEYRNIGDYDQNGTVGISDITPLAMLYGAHVGEDPLAVVVDGDGSNVVEIGDITPIAMNYGVNCAGCQIQAWDPSGIDYENLDTVDLTAATGKDRIARARCRGACSHSGPTARGDVNSNRETRPCNRASVSASTARSHDSEDSTGSKRSTGKGSTRRPQSARSS